MNAVNDLVAANPFPGLRPFATSEADRFFGREKQIAELVERIEAVNFVAVAGVSGCGKSSLVCAGVLSELARRSEAGCGTEWRCAVMKPGSKPIANLAQSLSPVLGGSRGSDESRTGSLYGRLRLGSLGLVEAVKIARLDAQIRVLLVVDQFEEIFRFRRLIDADEACAFVKLLLNAVRAPGSPVTVVLTLRSETLGSCAEFADLPEAINCGQYLVPKLTREQRKQSITKPVELRGFAMAPRLVQRLLNDVPNSFDDLPVMQHVLARIWNRWAEAGGADRAIDLEDYEAIGTTREALSLHAEQAYVSLPGLEPVIEKIFRALTEHVSEGIEVRRPLDFERLCRVVGASAAQVERVVERFRRPDTAFLMPPQEVPVAANPVLDISHESLIRQWGRLRDWTQAEARSRAKMLRLLEAVRLYESKEGSLWQGLDLSKALKWRKEAQPTAAWLELYTSGDGVSALASMDRFLELSSAGTRRDERLRNILHWAGVLLLIALAALAIGFRLLKQSKSTELANKSLLELHLNPSRSAQLALAALDMAPTNKRGESALRQALAALETARVERIIPVQEPVTDVGYSRDGSRLVIASGKTVRLFDAASFSHTASFSRGDNVWKAWLIWDNSVLVTQTVDGGLQLQKVGDPDLRQISCGAGLKSISAVAVSPGGRRVAAGCAHGTISIYDVSDLSKPPEVLGGHGATITALAFSKGDAYVASGDRNGGMRVWKVGHAGAWLGQEVFGGGTAIGHRMAIRDLGFDPRDPGLLVSASDDGQAIVWKLDLRSRQLAAEPKNRLLMKHERQVNFARFVGADRRTVMTVSDKTVRFWVDDTRDWRQMRRHEDWVNDANVLPEHELLATASSDGTARLWSTRSGGCIAVFRGHRDEVTRALFNPAGDQVVTASKDGTVRFWRFKQPRLVSTSRRWAQSVAYDPGGEQIAVGGEAGCSIVSARDKAPMMPDSRSQGSSYFLLSWSRDGRRLIGNKIIPGMYPATQPVLWDVENRQKITEITPEWFNWHQIALFNPGSDEVLTVDKTGSMCIWNAKSLDSNERPVPLTPEFGGESVRRLYVAMSPDGRWVAAADQDKVLLWDRHDLGAAPRKLQGHKGSVISLRFNGASNRLLTASRDLTAMIWSVDSSDPEVVLAGHTGSLFSASFDPSGRFAVTGSADGTVRVWDAEDGQEHAVLRWHGEAVNEVQFSPDGRSILSASDDGTVKMGQCEACLVPVAELRDRVKKYARVSDQEQNEIGREKAILNLPALFSKGP